MEASSRGKDTRIAGDGYVAQNRSVGVSQAQNAIDRKAVEAGQPYGPPPPRRPLRDDKSRPPRWPRVSVVIPTLNEALNLPHVLRALPDCVHEVVVVDGLSTDGTPEVALEHRPDAKVVYETGPGKGVALQRGFDAATGDILVMMDADGSADPYEIPAFLHALLAGADFAKGTRFCAGGGSSDITRLRSMGNRVLGAAVNLLFATQYTDLCYGYNAFWRHCLPAMGVDCNGFEVETLINIRVARAGLVVSEVPSFERDRLHGQSNLRTFRDGARVLRTIARERVRRAPPRHDVEAELARLATPIAEEGLLGTASD
jgi:glycosyltransferase involved in cell wall biosynthesis